jgi:DNA processing protein
MEIRSVSRHSSEYPGRFEKLSDPPSVLRVRGQMADVPLVAIVGTRHPEKRMVRFAAELASQLATRHIGIVSGGALGIDTAAHRGALDAGGVTVAVLGSGFEFIFPEKNRTLFEEIAKNGGAVVSEFPDHTPPARWTFPKRNRLVAAMAGAVVVVQAPLRSGSMITARISKGIGVPLGAIPGAPTDHLSTGCNRLIQGGARLISNVDDVIDLIDCDTYCQQLDLPGTVKQVMESTEKTPPGLSSEETRIWEVLTHDAIHIDDLALQTKLPMSAVSAAVLNMELFGLIEDSGGRRFIRK